MNDGAQTRQVNSPDAASRTAGFKPAGFVVCMSGYPQSGVLPLPDAQDLACRLRRRHPHESLSLYEVESRIHFDWIS